MRYKNQIQGNTEQMTNSSHPSTAPGSPFSFFGEAMAENPFPLFAHMRAASPVVPFTLPWTNEHQGWLITRMQEAVQILKDKRFTVDRRRIPSDAYSRLGGMLMSSETPGLFGQSMIMVDEPDHKRLRGLVSKAFTPKYIEGLRPHIQQIADELLDRVQAQGQMDLVHDYAYPLPINVISDMLGVPTEQRDSMRQWSQAIGGGPVSSREERRQLIMAFSNYIVALVAEKRQHPQQDLISQLIALEEDGDHLSESELLSMVGLLIFAGHETTSNLIGIGTLTLLDHPQQLEKLRADLSLVPSAVEELLRFNGPVTMPAPRFATEDVEFAGYTIHKGDMVNVVLASANHDESQFTDAEELDIARTLNRHIAFGQGIHICLGAPLARLEGEIAFTTLLTRCPNLRLNCPREAVQWRGGFNLRGLLSLPIAF
jgi:cytochrome P450